MYIYIYMYHLNDHLNVSNIPKIDLSQQRLEYVPKLGTPRMGFYDWINMAFPTFVPDTPLGGTTRKSWGVVRRQGLRYG